MKKTLVIIGMLLIVMSATASAIFFNNTVYCEEGEQILGDADSMYNTTSADAQIIYMIALDVYDFIDVGRTCCVDVNNDGNVTFEDANLAFEMYISGNNSQTCDY